jgi:phosphoribosylformylglycinamidine synthase
MAGLKYPIIVSHGEGRAAFGDDAALPETSQVMRYVDRSGQAATRYPANPNGSPDGLTAVCNDDGRVTAMMPHPERVFRRLQMSYSPQANGAYSPWMQLFMNGRRWLN